MDTITVCSNFVLAVGVTPALLDVLVLGTRGGDNIYSKLQFGKFDASQLSKLVYAIDVIKLEPPATDASAIYSKFRKVLDSDTNKFPPISFMPGNIPRDVVMEYHPFVYEPASGLWCRLDSHFSKDFVADLDLPDSKVPVLRAPKMN